MASPPETPMVVNKRISELAREDAENTSQSTVSTLERGSWAGKIEFILTCIGYAVGLGNVWRFPYLCFKNGGGTFLIPYCLMLALIGIPIFFFELCMGQFASLGPTMVWGIVPIAKGIGWGMVGVSWCISLYYIVIIAWAFYFLFASMTSSLPWADCSNAWNTPACVNNSYMRLLQDNHTLLGIVLRERNLSGTEQFKTPSEEFFYEEVLQLSGGLDEPGHIVWELALCLLLCWFIVFCVLIRGIKSLGKVVYVVAIFPYLMMSVLLVRGLTLPGAMKGIEFYMKPDLTRLMDFNVWSDAATQIFFSLSACTGGLVAMSSYNTFHNNCLRDSLIVPLINCATSVFAGFAIFAVLGFMAHEKGVEVADVADKGPGLVFVVYPEALSQMPLPTLWSILFFLMLILLGMSSEFSYVETFFVALMDEFPETLRTKESDMVWCRSVFLLIFYLITLPMTTQGGFYLFSLIDDSIGGFPLLILGFCELMAVQWIYGIEEFADDVCMMIGRRPNWFFKICWAGVTPALLLMVSVLKATGYTRMHIRDYTFPDWALAIGWLMVTFTLVWIPFMAVLKVIQNGGAEAIKLASLPLNSWGPAKPRHRRGRYASTNEPCSPVLSPSIHLMKRIRRQSVGSDIESPVDEQGRATSPTTRIADSSKRQLTIPEKPRHTPPFTDIDLEVSDFVGCSFMVGSPVNFTTQVPPTGGTVCRPSRERTISESSGSTITGVKNILSP